MKGAISLFQFLEDAARRGERSALVTITDVIGQSSRAPGTHMAVTETGAYHGSLSGGCVEGAVVGEALRIMASGVAECLRLGVDSPYIDIRLPCGGGLDLLVIPDPDRECIAAARRMLEDRVPVALVVSRDGRLAAEPASAPTSGWRDASFIAVHYPDLRVMILGHGQETEAVAQLAKTYGADVSVLSPDRDIVARLTGEGLLALELKTPARSEHLRTDAYTAVILLFHDHDWEQDLIAQSLEQQALFVGAMGSRNTHERRLENLRARGVPDAALERLTGPIGLIPATRDPDTLALSVLSQIASVYLASVSPRQ